jgi:hypothetical protein
MTKILDCLPLLPRAQNVTFGQRHIAVYRGALLVWLSIGLRGEDRPERISPTFPALLDSGNTYDFYMHEHHLVQWARIRPELLTVRGTKHINGKPVPCRVADVWIYPNKPGTHQRWEGKPPFRLRSVRNGGQTATRRRTPADRPRSCSPSQPHGDCPRRRRSGTRNPGRGAWNGRATPVGTAGRRTGRSHGQHKTLAGPAGLRSSAVLAQGGRACRVSPVSAHRRTALRHRQAHSTHRKPDRPRF